MSTIQQNPQPLPRGEVSQNLPLAQPPQRFITWRSVLLGSVFVTAACGIQPFNDHILANPKFIGSYLPLAVVLMLFGLVVLVNTPLHRFLPRQALSGGELATILSMTLIGCSMPMFVRTFIPSLVAPFYLGANDQQFWKAFVAMDLPGWLFSVESVREGRSSLIMSWFYGRIEPGKPIPYSAWIVPLGGWGVFLAAMFAALISLASIVRYQWAVNERLPFPLARFQSMLIDPPQRGRMLNELFRSRAFWICLIAVLAVKSTVPLHAYILKFPAVPLKYDLNALMANDPWRHLSWGIRESTIYFTLIGISYFIQSRVAFSMWAIFLAQELLLVQLRVMHYEVNNAARLDQHIGASLAFVGAILWIGRRHWWLVIRQTLGIAREDETSGDFGSYRWTTIVLIGSILVMVTWLMLLGVQWWVAGGIVGFMFIAHTMVSRIVAQTGLPFLRAFGGWGSFMQNLPPGAFSARDVFFSGILTTNTVPPTREGTMTFAMHAMEVSDSAGAPRRTRPAILALMAWALVLGFVVCSAASLWCYYSYPGPVVLGGDTIENRHGLELWPKDDVVTPMTAHAAGKFKPKQHNPWTHMGIGFVITGFLQYGSLRWATWPLAPVGFLISMTYFMQAAWFSIFLGWLAKVMAVRFGGARLFDRARPAFVGMIFGEALAAAVWVLINLSLFALGSDLKILRLLPD